MLETQDIVQGFSYIVIRFVRIVAGLTCMDCPLQGQVVEKDSIPERPVNIPFTMKRIESVEFGKCVSQAVPEFFR